MKHLKEIDLIVAVGSVDGVLTTAAVLRKNGTSVPIIWTQAFQVDQIKIDQLEAGRKILFIDLAVDNQRPERTAKFVADLLEAGHKIIGVCDEHCREHWANILDLDGLAIQPQSKSDRFHTSSGRVLLQALFQEEDEIVYALCMDAEKADAFEFVGYGEIANKAIKSALQDDSRRTYLANCFAFKGTLDKKIQGWIDEYEEILNNHSVIIEEAEADGKVVRLRPAGRRIDTTTLMGELYRKEFDLVVLDDQIFDKEAGRKVPVVSFGTGRKNCDLIQILKDAGVPAIGGFAQKVSVRPENERSVLDALRSGLKV